MGVVKRWTRVVGIFYKIYEVCLFGVGILKTCFGKNGFAGEKQCLMADAGPSSIWGDGG
jgi:hypothetical protein